MGYHPDLKVFAGFDLRKHSIFTTGSPSVQVDISVLYAALQSGLSFATKDNDEVVIGVRPDQFLAYCINAASLHSFGAESDVATLLTRAADMEEISEVDTAYLTADRKRIIGKVARYSRDANFRKAVLNAYDNRCAVTRFQLQLVDAAHILPVHSQNSSDHVKNGIALSPTFHRAYDNCLIFLDEDYVMRLNPEKVSELRKYNLDGGLGEFSGFLGRRIHLPSDRSQRPSAEYIRMANKHRRISGYHT